MFFRRLESDFKVIKKKKKKKKREKKKNMSKNIYKQKSK